jgi:hypothetical protein
MTKARTLADNYAADISGITAGTGITGGGTSGTVTITNDMATTIAAKGDLIIGTGNDTYNRLAVASTAGYVLTVDSAQTTGLKWAAAAAGGKMLQVVSTASTGYTYNAANATWTDSNLSGTITPASTSSKILVIAMCQIGSYTNTASQQNEAYARILRGATSVWAATSGTTGATWKAYDGTFGIADTVTLTYLDSPATTSSTTYKVQWLQPNNSYDHTLYFNQGGYPSQITLIEVGA